MKDKNRVKVFRSLLEMAIIMILLMGAFEFVGRFFSERFDLWQWNLITAGFAALIAVLITYFIVGEQALVNKKLQSEVKWLKKMEEDLRGKLDELSHFKDMVVWWEKRLNTVQEEMDLIKQQLEKHGSASDKEETV